MGLLIMKRCSEDKVHEAQCWHDHSKLENTATVLSFLFLYVISVKRLIASITAYVMQEFPQLFKGDI